MPHRKKHNHHKTAKAKSLSTDKKSPSSSHKARAGWLCGVTVALLYAYFVYQFFVGPFGFRWRAVFGDPSYPPGYEIHGIDISHHQGFIDWTKLSNAMIDRTYIRFIMVKATEGSDYIDEMYEENFRKAKEYNFIRGAYHYWSKNSTARQQAFFYIDHVSLEPGDLPPVLDVEVKPENMTTENFQLEILGWLHIVEDRYHTKPIIYTNYKFKEAFLNDERFDAYPLWIAHYYVNSVQYTGKWKFWQHTDVGKLPGIEGYVDLDIYNGSHYDLEQLTIQAIPDDLYTGLDSIGYEVNDSTVQPSSDNLD